jgi:hypothetical protein
MSGNYRNFTMIDELPDVDDIDDPSIKAQKVIRGTHKMVPESGMANYGHPPGHMQGPGPGHIQGPPGHLGQHGHPNPHEPIVLQNQVIEMQQAPPQQPYYDFPHNCIDIARHIHACPICSRFYNNDKTLYIVAIIMLSIICVLLLKRVLNV